MQLNEFQLQRDITSPTVDEEPVAHLKAEDISESEWHRQRRQDIVSARTDSETSRKAKSVNSYLKDSRLISDRSQ